MRVRPPIILFSVITLEFGNNYRTCSNLFPGVPHTGHFSGGGPIWVSAYRAHVIFHFNQEVGRGSSVRHQSVFFLNFPRPSKDSATRSCLGLYRAGCDEG